MSISVISENKILAQMISRKTGGSELEVSEVFSCEVAWGHC